jgi:hypothetical protein
MGKIMLCGDILETWCHPENFGVFKFLKKGSYFLKLGDKGISGYTDFL